MDDMQKAFQKFLGELGDKQIVEIAIGRNDIFLLDAELPGGGRFAPLPGDYQMERRMVNYYGLGEVVYEADYDGSGADDREFSPEEIILLAASERVAILKQVQAGEFKDALAVIADRKAAEGTEGEI